MRRHAAPLSDNPRSIRAVSPCSAVRIGCSKGKGDSTEPVNLMRCEECGTAIRHGRESDTFGGSADSPGRLLCLACYNQQMAEHAGMEFEEPGFGPLELPDAEGNLRRFSIAARLLGAQVSIEAYEEDADPGYQFQVIGRADAIQKLFSKLLAKMRRALTWQHLVVEDGRPMVADDRTVRGRFEWDEERSGEVPLLVIDGKEVRWDELGRAMTSFEGWQFKIEIYDRSDER